MDPNNHNVVGVGGKVDGVRRSDRLSSARSASQSSALPTQAGGGGGDAVPERTNDPAIVKAAQNGNLGRVMSLYHRDNVSPDSFQFMRTTALMMASQMGFALIVQFLISHKATLDCVSTAGFTALAEAAFNGHESILGYLIDAGANLNISNAIGRTPLMWAVLQDHRSCVARLLMEGADDTLMDKYGATAFDMAMRRNRPYAVRELWEEMKKAGLSDSKMDAVLGSAIVTNAVALSTMTDDSSPLAAFIHQVPEAMIMMQGIMSFLHRGAEAATDPRILDRNSMEYTRFATGVLNAYASLPAGIARAGNKSIDFFIPFVNADHTTLFTRERAIAMMKVLVNDRDYGYGRELDLVVNPLRLNLSTLLYNVEKDMIFL